MTIRIIEDELVLTRAEYNEYMAQYNELADRTQVCIDFEAWVRGLKAQEARRKTYFPILHTSPSFAQNGVQAAKPEDEGMRVWG